MRPELDAGGRCAYVREQAYSTVRCLVVRTLFSPSVQISSIINQSCRPAARTVVLLAALPNGAWRVLACRGPA